MSYCTMKLDKCDVRILRRYIAETREEKASKADATFLETCLDEAEGILPSEGIHIVPTSDGGVALRLTLL